MYSTKVTKVGNIYCCRIFFFDKPIVEGRCKSREHIGPTFRDLFRTLDKLGGDSFTNAARRRKFKGGSLAIDVKHHWYNIPLSY